MGCFNQSLSGQVICITGSFSCYVRRDLAGIIRSLGGEFTEDFTSRTTLLLKGKISKSSKRSKAQEKMVRVIREREFCERYGLHYQLQLEL